MIRCDKWARGVQVPSDVHLSPYERHLCRIRLAGHGLTRRDKRVARRLMRRLKAAKGALRTVPL